MTRLALCVAVAVVFVGVGQVEGAINLTHLYAFDTDASDSAGTNHGTLSNGASIVFDSQRGDVLQLDGVDDYVNLGWSNVPGGPTDTATFTIAAWVKIPAGDVAFANIAPIYGEYVGYQAAGGSKNYFAVDGISHGVNRSGEVFFSQHPSDAGIISSVSTINDGEWHHVAYVQNEPGSSKRKIYIDGTLDKWLDNVETYSGLAPDLWTIGGRLNPGSYRYFQGHLDDVRFYDGALTANEIVSLIPEPSSLIVWSLIAITFGGFGWWRKRRQ
jgi:concanavalin A-like lectin/glucanase superfamily protein